MTEFLQHCGSWGVFATLAAYALGVWVNRKTKLALFNPLLMGSIFMIVFLRCFAIPYADYSASAAPVNWLLAPATVSLAIPLYEKWELLEKNVGAIWPPLWQVSSPVWAVCWSWPGYCEWNASTP